MDTGPGIQGMVFETAGIVSMSDGDHDEVSDRIKVKTLLFGAVGGVSMTF